MQGPQLIGTVIIIFLIISIIANNFFNDDTIENFRKKQVETAESNESDFSKKMESYLNTKVKFTKRMEIELLAKQAGYNLKYYQYFSFQVLCSAVLFFFSLIVVKNEFLAVEMIFLGSMIPKQILTHVRNKRVEKLEKQLSPFFQMIIQRYLSSQDMEKSLRLTREEFVGMDPMYTEITRTVAELDSKVPISEALDNLAKRSMNKYLARFSDYYKMASNIGTQAARKDLLGQVKIQYEEDKALKNTLNTEISEQVRDSHLMIASIPLFGVFGALMMDGWTEFMFGTLIGKIVIASMFGVVMAVIWFINNKIGAPLR